MFITLEGIEGSGKTTLIENLADVFRTLNHEVLVTREPGGCALGRELRQMLLNPETEICPEAELFLFLADRAQHVAEVIRPALKRGEVVLCDRYADSTVVYQGYGRGLDIEKLRSLNDVAIGGLWPDRTFVLDMDPADALKRARRRNAELGLSEKEGRFEAALLSVAFRLRRLLPPVRPGQPDPPGRPVGAAAVPAEAAAPAGAADKPGRSPFHGQVCQMEGASVFIPT